MPTNPHFNQFHHESEQNLHKELVRESIEINGIDVYYLPATRGHVDDVWREDEIRSFQNAYQIEMYMMDIEGFGGQGDFLAKFGIQIDDTLDLQVSSLAFNDFVLDRTKPQEGDLIYLPFSMGSSTGVGTVFEIHFVEDEEPFYQFGEVPGWKIVTKLFEYSGERFSTGISEIDNMQYTNAYQVDITLDTGSGTYLVGENVYQPSSNLVAKVAEWNATTKVLTVVDITADVSASKTVVGNTSGATYSVSSFDQMEFPEDAAAQNEEFETEANTFVNFDETSPFGSW